MKSGKITRNAGAIRASGILLPIFSLPSRYGIGTIGSEAYRFIDFLKASGQTYWQILPIGPTSYGDSPYQSFSAFAANPYFIDLDILEEKQLLSRKEIENFFFGDDPLIVDYGLLYQNRLHLLELATDRFTYDDEGFNHFQKLNADWLDDYALFMALKEENATVPFMNWEEPLRMRDEKVIRHAKIHLEKRIRFWKVLQYLFFDQWSSLKNYAHKKGIKIIGDIPIYVAEDSVDLWTHSELFQLDKNLKPIAISGCPPDGFTSNGQLWGNPLYDWEYHKKTGFRWWLRRLQYAESVYDVVRIDHFRGFAGYYSIPSENSTAKDGTWYRAPGRELLTAIKEQLPGGPIIAEDLGYLTEDVKSLLRESGFPGMKVLQFAFDSREQSDYLPHNYDKNCVVYTGTHDNTTTYDWQFSAPAADVAFARKYLNITSKKTFTESFIRAAIASVANTVIVPLQDYLGYGTEARINTPGTIGKNWQWRMKTDVLTTRLSDYIYDLTALYGRLGIQG